MIQTIGSSPCAASRGTGRTVREALACHLQGQRAASPAPSNQEGIEQVVLLMRVYTVFRLACMENARSSQGEHLKVVRIYFALDTEYNWKPCSTCAQPSRCRWPRLEHCTSHSRPGYNSCPKDYYQIGYFHRSRAEHCPDNFAL